MELEPARCQVVVLCGGLGTRMRSVAGDLPKVLIEVAGRPFLHHLLTRLEAAGFERALLCIGHGAELVREAADRWAAGQGSTHPEPAMQIVLASDGERLLGTAGALRSAVAMLDPVFLVTYGDSYLPFDYVAPLAQLDAARAQGRDVLGCMAVYENHDRLEPSNVAVRGDRVVRYDKARAPGEPRLDHIDYGATALVRSLIEALPAGEPIGLDHVQSRAAMAGQLLAHRATERFYEIGSRAGLAELSLYLDAARSDDRRRGP